MARIRWSIVAKVVGWFFLVMAAVTFVLVYLPLFARPLRITGIFVFFYFTIAGSHLIKISWYIRLHRCILLGIESDGMNWRTSDQIRKFKGCYAGNTSLRYAIGYLVAGGVLTLALWIHLYWIDVAEWLWVAPLGGGFLWLLSGHFFRLHWVEMKMLDLLPKG